MEEISINVPLESHPRRSARRRKPKRLPDSAQAKRTSKGGSKRKSKRGGRRAGKVKPKGKRMTKKKKQSRPIANKKTKRPRMKGSETDLKRPQAEKKTLGKQKQKVSMIQSQRFKENVAQPHCASDLHLKFIRRHANGAGVYTTRRQAANQANNSKPSVLTSRHSYSTRSRNKGEQQPSGISIVDLTIDSPDEASIEDLVSGAKDSDYVESDEGLQELGSQRSKANSRSLHASEPNTEAKLASNADDWFEGVPSGAMELRNLGREHAHSKDAAQLRNRYFPAFYNILLKHLNYTTSDNPVLVLSIKWRVDPSRRKRWIDMIDAGVQEPCSELQALITETLTD